MFRSTAVAAVLAVSLLSACGSSSSDDATTSQAAAAPAATAPAATPTTPAATPTTTTATPAASKKELVAKCHATLDGTVEDVKGLEPVAKVDSGYKSYSTEVQRVQTAIRNLTFQNAPKSGNCVQLVLTNASQSLNHYINAMLLWSKCDAKKSCSDRSIAPELQKEWKEALSLIHAAETSFDKSTA
jgi:hypothetical protein